MLERKNLLGGDILSFIISLVGKQCLECFRETHSQAFGVPHRRLVACSKLSHCIPHALGIVFQTQIERGLVSPLDVLQRLDRLMPFIDLDTCDVLGPHIVRGHTVRLSHHIHSFDVETIDWLTIIGDPATFLDRYSRHLFQHIAYSTVCFITELSDIVHNGVAFR